MAKNKIPTLGCITSPKDKRNYRINMVSTQIFPENFTLEPSIILNQGSVGSCVAHATTSAIYDIYNKQFSVGWVYGNRPSGYMGSGMYITDALKTALKIGCVLKKDFNYNVEMTEIYDKVQENYSTLEPLAIDYKIGKYAELFSDVEIKTALMKGLPVIAAITIKEDYLSMNENYIINITNGSSVGGHAILLYGWTKDGWLMQNSWGKSWGNNGTAILPYAYGIDESYTISQVEEDISKPKYYQWKKLMQKLIDIFKNCKCSKK
jgi:hypothetical protein